MYRHRIDVWRNNTGAYTKEYECKDGRTSKHHVRHGRNGAADIHGVIPPHGRHVSVECKREGRNLDPEQVAEKQRIESKGGVYILARSVDDLERELKPLLGAI